jgi:hypothetical protein
MLGLKLPWFIDQTISVTAFCPVVQHEVTVRYLACQGLPPTLIGCDDTTCTMSCLDPVAPAPAHPERRAIPLSPV